MNSLKSQIAESAEKVNKFIEKAVDIENEPKELYIAARHIIDAGGKRLRPFLVLKSCELVGENKDDALATASALELLHTFTLLHDDIMDQDEKRRGVPSVHKKWGIPLAIVAGDLLFAKVYEIITKNTDTKRVAPKKILNVLQEISEATIILCEGQALDMMFENKKIIIAFQIIDDILALTAEEKILKKPIGNDIREGKRTLMVVYALEKATKNQRKEILETLGNKNASNEQIKKTIALIDSLGAIKYAKKLAEKYIKKAKKMLSIFPSSENRDDLINLADLIFSRQN
ncbi:MAG: polyprenyl synthetase family protein [Candidatus Bathyarchaeota archaeon]